MGVDGFRVKKIQIRPTIHRKAEKKSCGHKIGGRTYIHTDGGAVYKLALQAKKITKVLELIDLATFRLVAKYLYLVLRKLRKFL